MKIFILTLQFLTRIPLNFKLEVTEDDFAKGVVYFPIVGLIIGAFNLLIYYLSGFLLDGIFPLVCTVLANIAITGGLHLDGLADTCDGIFSSRTKERMLEIMKDSRIGTNGSIALIMDLLLRIGILYSLPNNILFYTLLIAPIASRTAVIIIMKISRYARSSGMGGLFLEKQSALRTLIGAVIGLALSFAVMKYAGLIVLTAAIITGYLFRLYIYRKIGGMTGDTVGAANEIVELTTMLLIAVIWRYGYLC